MSLRFFESRLSWLTEAPKPGCACDSASLDFLIWTMAAYSKSILIHPRQEGKCGPCALCQHNLLGLVDTQQTANGHPHACDQVEYNANDAIFREGRAGTYVYSVCKGLVKLDQKMPGGNTRCVRLLQGGGVFGLELLSNAPYHHSAISIGRTRVCRIPAQQINHLAVIDPILFESLMRQWQQAIDEADFVISQLSTGSARQRVARLLTHMCNAHDSEVCQALPRDDMASLLGLTPETVSRTAAALKREGVVNEQNGVFTCDVTHLQRIADADEAAPPKRPSSSP